MEVVSIKNGAIEGGRSRASQRVIEIEAASGEYVRLLPTCSYRYAKTRTDWLNAVVDIRVRWSCEWHKYTIY